MTERLPLVDVTELTPDTATRTFLGDVTINGDSLIKGTWRDCIIEINPVSGGPYKPSKEKRNHG